MILAPVVFVGAAELALYAAGYGVPARFLLPAQGGYSTNPKYGWRFFPPAVARTPAPVLIQSPKPAGITRVAVLGESAAMGFPDPLFGFASQLEHMLGSRYEVINASMTAINSHVLREVARDLTRIRPDWFVLYMGNNEVVGPYGLSTPAAAWPGWRIGAHLALKRMRLGQFMESMVRGGAPAAWRGIDALPAHRVHAGDPRMERVYAHFRWNLEDIIETARAAGSRVVVCTVAVNLKDSPPFAGEAALAAYRAGEHSRARDLDELRFRADSTINSILRQVAPAKGAVLVDAERILVPGAVNFWEHVHLTPTGHSRLARLVLGAMKLDGSGGEVPATAWDLYRMARTISELMDRPPFTLQWNHAARRTQRMSELAELRRKSDPAQAVPVYRTAIARRDNDLILRERYAELLAELGQWPDVAEQYGELLRRLPNVKSWHTGLAEARLRLGNQEEASKAYQAAIELDPYFPAAHIGLGTVLAAQGQPGPARESFIRALDLDPDSPQAHNNLGRLHDSRGRPAEAIAEYRSALRGDAAFSTAHYNLANALARTGRREEAIRHFEETLRIEPDFAPAHYDLGVLLAQAGRVEEAIAHYRDALRLEPRHADAHNNWGSALARQGRISEAITHFEDALRIDPKHVQAGQNLERARNR